MFKYSTLNQEAIQAILGIKENVPIDPLAMAHNLKITFFPNEGPVKEATRQFAFKFRDALVSLGVKIIPYDKTLITITDKEGNTRVGVRRGIAIISIGGHETGKLPVDRVENFSDNPIVSILDWPRHITNETSYKSHIDTAVRLFALNMANLVICVRKNSWLTYSFNGSYPVHKIDNNFNRNVLNTIITKLAAPLRPPYLEEFVKKENAFDVSDTRLALYIQDLINSGKLFSKTELYSIRKLMVNLPFRNDFYAWVGSLLLDKRNGMSYGFLSRQLPVKLSKVMPLQEAKKHLGISSVIKKHHFMHNDNIYLVLKINNRKYCLRVPEIFVLTTRSGSEKTKLNKSKDIIKMGLSAGRMILEFPKNSLLPEDYKPSFDTKTIMAHAVANAIYASILKFFKPNSVFCQILEEEGMALAHWHGYIKPEFIPEGWAVYGVSNPAVSCATLQAAIYAFRGKERVMMDSLYNKKYEYLGDVHIEPQHGINISWRSLEGLANYLLSDKDTTKLGNEYFKYYHSFSKS